MEDEEWEEDEILEVPMESTISSEDALQPNMIDELLEAIPVEKVVLQEAEKIPEPVIFSFKDVQIEKEIQLEECDLLTIDANYIKKYINTIKDVEKRKKIVCKIAEEIYGKELYCFDTPSNLGISCNSSTYYCLVIHFPEIEIKNETSKHTIKDLFVVIQFTNTMGYNTSNIWGFRATREYKEIIHTYGHSHLRRVDNKNSFNQLKDFCVGTNTIMSNAIEECRINSWDFKNLRTILITLNDYVRWESDAGGPYFRIKNLTISSSDTSSNLPYLPEFKHFMSNIQSFPFVVESVYNNYKLTIPRNNKELLKLIEDNTTYKIHCNSKGEIDDISLNEGGIKILLEKMQLQYRNKHLLKFNGKDIEFKFESPNIENRSSILKTHPDIVDYIISELETQLNNHFIKYC